MIFPWILLACQKLNSRTSDVMHSAQTQESPRPNYQVGHEPCFTFWCLVVFSSPTLSGEGRFVAWDLRSAYDPSTPVSKVFSCICLCSSSISYSPFPSPITSSSSDSPLCTSITPSLFHSRLKTYLFHKSYPPPQFHFFLPDCLHGLLPGPLLLSYSAIYLFFVSGPCARLSWPSRQLLSSRQYTVSYRIVSYAR